MQGRVQVIVVVTGIGGRAVQTVVQPETVQTTSPRIDTNMIDSDDLDLPTFLRKRAFSVGR
jgi:hypothetical protein